ncbi:peptidoglycan-binding domain-containing protein [Microvirga sp. 17 mud 1-3]|uniref:peptidoglycan-binding domain-containing protein n=1 Tax=Microvirga sp. 17 mud 1-3 TaxID=2082949 RepID=UPI0013A56EAB|nr:peptidoglycan-binding domain-containing protein [Microvirga sp. 17 mud 1-3]
MREALAARPDDDFVTSAPPPARRSAPARRPAASRKAPVKARKEPGFGAKTLAFLVRRPGAAVSALLLTGCAAAIAWNALVLQTVRHPAPLFNRDAYSPAEGAVPAQTILPPTRPVPVAAPLAEAPVAEAPPAPAHAAVSAPPAPATPAPVPAKPSSRSAIADLITKGEVTQPQRVTAVATPAPPPGRMPPPPHDSIAEMIRMGGPVPVPPASVGRPEADSVLLGQRALAKLGYSVKPDGIMGSETRQAIERFERARQLPVTGEFGARTLRELATLSGLPLP